MKAFLSTLFFKEIAQRVRFGFYICVLAVTCTALLPSRPAHADWLVDTFAKQYVIPQLQRFAEQMSIIAMHQAFIVGTFLDAKHQLETQRLFQELQIQAHKDYQPSNSFCTLGTAVRSLAHSDTAARYSALALSQRQLARHLGKSNMAGASKEESDFDARWRVFSTAYCDPKDNNAKVNDPTFSGLNPVCANDKKNADRVNIDIDYTRMIENRRTIGFSYAYPVSANDEFDVMALGNNLYGHNVLFRIFAEGKVDDKDKDHLYMKLRSVAAKRSVAENSFTSIVGLKSMGSAGGAMNNAGVNTYKFLGRILMDLGIPEREVKEYLGLDPRAKAFPARDMPDYIPDPSYYAQLEILAKKIYQTPYFYANLYDTPTNVRRKSAALTAIELMLDRAIFESQLRQEMALSVLLSSRLEKNFEEANK